MADVTITPRNDGPYLVRGPIQILDPDGNEVTLPEGAAIALCRCGSSNTKPFCDGTHKAAEFKSEVKAS